MLIKHQDFVILPGIALYDTSYKYETTKSKPIENLEAFYHQYYERTKKFYRLIGSFPFSFFLVRKLTIWQMNNTYPFPEFHTIWIKNDTRTVRFHVDRCFYHALLTSYQRSNLTKVFCNIDDYLYEDMSKKYIWKRKNTMGRGDELCDFCFEANGE